MNYFEILDFILKVHGTVLGAAILAYYKFGDRTDLYSKSLSGSDSILEQVKKEISISLGDSLKRVIKESEIVKPILNFKGNWYREDLVIPLESEEFREVIYDFVEKGCLVKYKILIESRYSWCKWFKILSWTILFLLIWQVIALIFTGSIRIFQPNFPNWVVISSVIPTVFGVLCCVLELIPILQNHDKIIKYREKYYGL